MINKDSDWLNSAGAHRKSLTDSMTCVKDEQTTKDVQTNKVNGTWPGKKR